MKSKLIILTAMAALAVTIFFNACKKNDTTPPVVTLNGSSTMTLSLNATQPADPGATANDDVDGAVTPTSTWSSSNPNMNLAGSYTITYSATDKAGNTGTASRLVTVQNDAGYLAGTYTDSISSGATLTLDTVFTQVITASNIVNNKIFFTKLGDFIGDTLDATVTGTSVAIDGQTKVGIGQSGCTHTFSPNGTGQTITQSFGKNTFSILYTDMEQVGGSGCPGYTALPTQEVLHQQ